MRIVQLPADSELDHVTAEIEHGELTVRVPRGKGKDGGDQGLDVQ